jgi:hypothetical protein
MPSFSSLRLKVYSRPAALSWTDQALALTLVDC